MPEKMTFSQASVISGKVYVGGGDAKESDAGWPVHMYDPERNGWSTLPRAPVGWCGVGQLNGRLVLVGGTSDGEEMTADVHVFDEETQQWVKPIPSMPSALAYAAVISHGSALVVCGGTSPPDGNPSAAVYVYNSESSQWHSASPLPFRRTLCTGVVINNICYIAAGSEVVLNYEDESMDVVTLAHRSVVSAPFPSLLDPNTSSSQTSSVWKSLPDLPYYHPFMAAVGGCLLALGGHKKISSKEKDIPIGMSITAVHAYCPATSSWLQIGDLPTQCFFATTALLPTGELLLTGGLMAGKENVSYIGTIN